MKNMKKIIAPLFALTLVGSLAACGDSTPPLQSAYEACKGTRGLRSDMDIRADGSQLSYRENNGAPASKCVLKKLGFPDSTLQKMQENGNGKGSDSYNGIEVAWSVNPVEEWLTEGNLLVVEYKVQK